MDTELRKRLEEAAELCQQYQEIYGGNFATAYMKGYTDGYKEAFAECNDAIVDIANEFFGDFEQSTRLADKVTERLNKLWEDEK